MSNSGYRKYAPKVASDALMRLALDLRWSWNHATDDLWEQLDPELWELTHNPWIVLQSVSPEKLQQATKDPAIKELLEKLLQHQKELENAAWFQNTHPDAALKAVAYFSMEYMLSESLPIYSGGLGNVAGDQLKAASDLGVPVVAVGLLYQQGYFRQTMDAEGRQLELYPYNDPGQLPISPVRQANGEWLRLRFALPGAPLWIRAWQVQVGRNRLYLLDTNDPANLPIYRGVTSQLYGGGSDLRLKQELVLGIAGWRLLRALDIDAEICHLNEGHAAFAVLERARCWMEDEKSSFDVALAATRAGNLFTTHTALAAGSDVFSPELMATHLRKYAEFGLGISYESLLALGRLNASDVHEQFNMAYLAVRGSGRINGVSRLHGEVSRALFQRLFPRWPQHEVPVKHVTNGVHMPSWDSVEADQLWTSACGKDRWREPLSGTKQAVRQVSDVDLWQMRAAGRKSLVLKTRELLLRQLAARGAAEEEAEIAKDIFNPETMTIGFARRFAAYKRPNLLLHDPERLLRILTSSRYPVQLVLAGKAYPNDPSGEAMLEQWVRFIRRPEARRHVVFLEDYDMGIAESLVQGVDLWINTPQRPWEACGTSGMKVLVNGGMNLSELDGWWAEAYSPDVGWAIGDGKEHGDNPEWDAVEANELYTLLEQNILPEFYARDQRGIPVAWITRMRESMARLTPAFSATRSVREYTEKHYLPAAKAYRERSAASGGYARELCGWARELEQHWHALRFGEVKVETSREGLVFLVNIYLGGLDPDAVKVELYADGLNGGECLRHSMTRELQQARPDGWYLYAGRVSSDRAAGDYTPRVIPCRADASIPLEAAQILWQH